MKAMRMTGKRMLGSATIIGGLIFGSMGCGGGFLGLQDYGRDLLLAGGLASGVLLSDANGDGGATAPVPDIQGPRGLPGEQGSAGDAGVVGQDGAAGADGAVGPEGPTGPVGLAGTDGARGPAGDAGPQGDQGSSGSSGSQGAPGDDFFTIFVDDFFATESTGEGSLEIVMVQVVEPALQTVDDAIAFRVAIPEIYDAGNDVTMRLFLDVTDPDLVDCFVFTVDGRRLRHGQDVEDYGTTRWVRVDNVGSILTEGGRVELVVDLPINSAAGLDSPLVASGELLAFELTVDQGCTVGQPAGDRPGFGCPQYHLVGVEFFESNAGDAQVSGGQVYESPEDVVCPNDCNGNGIPDDQDILDGASQDCNANLIPDECDISSETSNDCQPNGIPDECDIANADETAGGVASAVAAVGGLMFSLDGSEVPVDFCADGGTGNRPAQCTGTPVDQHNDDDSATVALPFSFDLYGTAFDTAFINNNGNLSFGAFFSTFTASGFPVSGFPMVAPFWGDVDTGNPGNQLGDVVMRFMDGDTSGTDETLIVTWNNVGYYNEHGDLRSTFQVAISDGTNPLMGIGNNVCFSYQSMQWTTGDASQGAGGFGGVPATVGVNAGNGTDFFQIGRFDHAGTDYDGPDGNTDGVQYLDGQQICLNTSTQDFNIAPIASNFPPGNQVAIPTGAGGVLDLEVLFLSPETGQTNDVTYVVSTVDGTPGAPGLNLTVTPGNVATVQLDWTPGCQDAGTYDIAFTATDDFDPPGVTDITLQVIVAACGTGDCNGDGIPDECQLGDNDCNQNGVPDDCDGGCPE